MLLFDDAAMPACLFLCSCDWLDGQAHFQPPVSPTEEAPSLELYIPMPPLDLFDLFEPESEPAPTLPMITSTRETLTSLDHILPTYPDSLTLTIQRCT